MSETITWEGQSPPRAVVPMIMSGSSSSSNSSINRVLHYIILLSLGNKNIQGKSK